MADGNITLLAPNISDDDRLWIARCDLNGLREFIANPIQWVANLSRDAQGAPRYILTSTYVVEFRPKMATPQSSSAVVIEGISSTPFVTVRISAGAPTPPPNLAQWDAWGDQDVAIRGVSAEGLIYGHLKIVNATDAPAVRVSKLFEMLVGLSSDLSLMNRLLNRRARNAIFVTAMSANGVNPPFVAEQPPTPISFAPVQNGADSITIVMEGDANEQIESCAMFVGTQDPPLSPVIIETLGIKTYYPEI
ncbi:MAG: hypothetical protein KF784_15535 [Fimbriimonadaceae bacterium]|nr:hypothetical protein [Fimbriimonadaceae bacterium]